MCDQHMAMLLGRASEAVCPLVSRSNASQLPSRPHHYLVTFISAINLHMLNWTSLSWVK